MKRTSIPDPEEQYRRAEHGDQRNQAAHGLVWQSGPFGEPSHEATSEGQTGVPDRKAETVALNEVQPLTGYIRGGAGGLKQQFLTWEVLTGDAPEPDGAMASPAGVELRADSVWIWQGLNPIPKKLSLGTGKSKISFECE